MFGRFHWPVNEILETFWRPGQEKPFVFVQTLYSGGQRGSKDWVKNGWSWCLGRLSFILQMLSRKFCLEHFEFSLYYVKEHYVDFENICNIFNLYLYFNSIRSICSKNYFQFQDLDYVFVLSCVMWHYFGFITLLQRWYVACNLWNTKSN